MKLISLSLASVLLGPLAHAQLVVPAPPAPRVVANAAMVIQSGGQTLELLPGNRAIRQTNGRYMLVAIDAATPISNDMLPVAYSYAIGGNVVLSGEVSFKVKGGSNLAALGPWASGAKVLAPPNVYVMAGRTVEEVVNLINQLKASSAVEWVEAFVLPVKLDK